MSENILDVLIEFATQDDDKSLADEAKKAIAGIYQTVEKLKELGFPETIIYIGATVEEEGLTSFQFYAHDVEIKEMKEYSEFKKEHGIEND